MAGHVFPPFLEPCLSYQKGLSHLEAWCRENPGDVDRPCEPLVGGGHQPLIFLVASELNVDAMRVLLRHGSDLTQMEFEFNVLHLAASGTPCWDSQSQTQRRLDRQTVELMRLRMVELLLDAGADVDVKSVSLQGTALYFAARSANLCCIKLLLSRGADVFYEDQLGHGVEKQRLPMDWISDFILDVKAAGGWRPYVTAPRLRLMVLRVLCDRRRATPPGGVLARAFALPQDVLWYVLAFWRHDRDYLGPNSYAANREFELWRDDRNYLFPDS